MAPKEKCPYCGRYFARIQTHFQQSSLCRLKQNEGGFLFPPFLSMQRPQSNVVSLNNNTPPKTTNTTVLQLGQPSVNTNPPQSHQPNPRSKTSLPKREEQCCPHMDQQIHQLPYTTPWKTTQATLPFSLKTMAPTTIPIRKKINHQTNLSLLQVRIPLLFHLPPAPSLPL